MSEKIEPVAIKRWHATGDYAYPSEEAADGEFVDYDDHATTVSALEARVEELEGALRVALDAIEETCNEMTVGDRFTNAGQLLLDALPVCRSALTKVVP